MIQGSKSGLLEKKEWVSRLLQTASCYPTPAFEQQLSDCPVDVARKPLSHLAKETQLRDFHTLGDQGSEWVGLNQGVQKLDSR